MLNHAKVSNGKKRMPLASLSQQECNYKVINLDLRPIRQLSYCENCLVETMWRDDKSHKELLPSPYCKLLEITW